MEQCEEHSHTAAQLVLGPAVLISGAIAAEVAAALRVGIREIERRDAYRFPAEVFDVLVMLQTTAALHIDNRHCQATDKIGSPGSLRDMDEVMPAEAARLLGISRQAVAGRIARGTLPARRTATGRFLIRRKNLEVA
jgi:hypothetical protein